MKRTTVKLLCLAAALACVLSGCSMVKVDQVMQLAEDTEKLKQDYSAVVADYDGGEVTVMEVTGPFNTSYTQLLYYYYSYYGSISNVDQATVDSLREDVLNERVESEICLLKAQERGIALTDEETKDCDSRAADAWKNYYETYYDSYAEGEDEQQKDASANYMLYKEGITQDALVSQYREREILTKLTDALKAEAPAPTDEDLKARYDENVESWQDKYAADPTAFETDSQGDGTVWWVPEGYRAVKHILFVPDEATLTAWKDAKAEVESAKAELDDLNSEKEALADDDSESERTEEQVLSDIEAAQARLAKAEEALNARSQDCLAAVREKTDEVYERFADGEGEDFTSLISELAADSDPGMTSGKTAQTGYYVSALTTTYVPEFKAAAMALAEKGSISEPVVSEYGVHILYYFDDVVSGPVAFDSVRDTLEKDLTEEMRSDYYDSTVAAWVNDAKPHYYYDRWTVSD